jgi:hypothetical protein
MKGQTRILALASACVLAIATAAAAQSPAPRVFIGINGGVQPSIADATGRLEFEENAETANATIDYPTSGGPAFEGSIGVRLWKQIGVGVAVSRFTADGDADVTASIPHPFFFNRPREISGTQSVSRAETGVHIQVMFIVPTSNRLQVILFGGPSRIEAEQDVVTGVRYDEEFPFDTATFRSADTRSFKASEIGFHAGADVAFMFTRNLGVGALVRFSRASVDLGPDDSRVSTDVGGVQAGGGLRISF